jgi:hypothetical protein
MWNDNTVVMKNFYGMTPPSKKALKDRELKVKEIIEQLGSKYCLSKPVEKLN